MRRPVLAIYDSKAELYGEPIVAVAVGVVVREFADRCSDGKSEYWKHPEDFTLFQIGVYDDSEGKLIAQVPVSLGNGVTFRTDGPSLVKEA